MDCCVTISCGNLRQIILKNGLCMFHTARICSLRRPTARELLRLLLAPRVMMILLVVVAMGFCEGIMSLALGRAQVIPGDSRNAFSRFKRFNMARPNDHYRSSLGDSSCPISPRRGGAPPGTSPPEGDKGCGIWSLGVGLVHNKIMTSLSFPEMKGMERDEYRQ